MARECLHRGGESGGRYGCDGGGYYNCGEDGHFLLTNALTPDNFCYYKFLGFHIVSKVALNIGVSKVVYPVYRFIIALPLLGPFAYFLEKKERPSLTFFLLAQFFLLALVGITANWGFYILGLYYASPTLASAMQNLVPAITFIMSYVLRYEGLVSLPLSSAVPV